MVPWKMTARPFPVPDTPSHAPSPNFYYDIKKSPFPPQTATMTPPHLWEPRSLPAPRQTLAVREPGFVGRGRNRRKKDHFSNAII